MRDFAQKWTAFPDWQHARLSAPDWQARCLTGLSQVLVSGALPKAWEELEAGDIEVGLWGLAPAQAPYRVRIGRDRALLVSSRPIAFESGWNAAGWAATAAHDAFQVIEIQGAAVEEVIMEATSADLRSGSPSASVRFAGLQGVLLYRSAPDCARLHAEASYLPYLWHWLETRKG